MTEKSCDLEKGSFKSVFKPNQGNPVSLGASVMAAERNILSIRERGPGHRPDHNTDCQTYMQFRIFK